MNRFIKLAKIVLRPTLWPALLRGVAATIEHDDALGLFDFSTIIDVGANKGQFAAYAKWRWPNARLICFEPLPEPRAKLSVITDPQDQIFDCALGEADGEASMHVASRTDSSSLLPLGELQKTIFEMDEIASVSVPVRRLDHCISADIKRPSLLKIDVQGYELEVLKGARAILPLIDTVYVEVSYAELYLGQSLHDDVEALLVNNGFKTTGVYNSYTQNGKLIQSDNLYGKHHLPN